MSNKTISDPAPTAISESFECESLKNTDAASSECLKLTVRKNDLLNHPWFLILIRIGLGGIFLYAGATKIINPQAFADSISTFQMLPPQFINLIALGLPPFEVILGIQLLFGWKLRAGLLAALLLALVFVMAIGQGIARGLPIDCGCFGSSEPSVLSAWFSFGRAFLLAVASAWAFSRADRA